MASAGYAAAVKVSGTSTSFTGEATTGLGDDVYQITDETKRVLDPTVAVVVKDDGVAIPAADVTVDHLFGRVTLANPPSGVVTVDGSYLPMLTVATAREASVSCSREIHDNTRFGAPGAARTKQYGLKDFSGSIGVLEDTLTDHDSGAGTLTLEGVLTSGAAKLIEFRPAATGAFFRGWAVFESEDVALAVDDLVNATINFTGAAQSGVAFGWGE